MQFLNEGFFLWRENKIQTYMALCEKVFAPHPLLKHNWFITPEFSFSSHIQAWLLPHLFAIKKSLK